MFKDWNKFWKERKIDWKTQYFDTWNHPHRVMLAHILGNLPWVSLMEIGCGAGANLVQLIKALPNRPMQLGGVDLNPDAITEANKQFQGGFFKVGSGEDLMLSDNSTDVLLTDMTLIYVSPRKIGRYISELKRISRMYVVLCEFHSESLWQRFKIWLNSGYFTYNYKKLLAKHGFYDIQAIPIPQQVWPDSQQVRTIVIAKTPKR